MFSKLTIASKYVKFIRLLTFNKYGKKKLGYWNYRKKIWDTGILNLGYCDFEFGILGY